LGDVPARFHEETLRRFGLEYAVDPDAMEKLIARAAALGVSFPASFVEWYSLRSGMQWLGEHGCGDQPVAIDRLGEAPAGALWTGVEKGVLPFLVENQGVCAWGIPVAQATGGSPYRQGDADRADEDPPVLVACDPDYEWRPYADRFSTFVWCGLWDTFKFAGTPGAPRVVVQAQAQERSLRSEDLALLRASFHERPTTHGFPLETQYRFERDDARILIWDGDQTDWLIGAADEETLVSVLREVWRFGTLARSLYSDDWLAEAVLAELRMVDRLSGGSEET
jgi:hypothetical protein